MATSLKLSSSGDGLSYNDGTVTLKYFDSGGIGLNTTKRLYFGETDQYISNTGSDTTTLTSPVFTVTSSKATTGSDAAFDVNVTGVQTGLGMDLTGSALTEGTLLNVSTGTANTSGTGLSVTTNNSTASSNTGTCAKFITNTQAGKGISVTMDAITTGDMLYLDAGNGDSMETTGSFINCNDDDTSYFKVSKWGITTISPSSSHSESSAALTIDKGSVVITNGDVNMSSGDLAVSNGNVSVTSGSVSSKSLTVTQTGTDNATSIYGNSINTANVCLIQGTSTTTGDILQITGTDDTLVSDTSGGTDGHYLNIVSSGSSKFSVEKKGIIKTAASLMIQSLSAASETNATRMGSYGQLWVKSGSASELYFRTSGNTDIQITSGSSLASTPFSSHVEEISGQDNSLFIGVDPSGNTGYDNPAGNTSLGLNALGDITTGDLNTVIGFNAGKALTTGGDNVIIGHNSGQALTSNTQTNGTIAIGTRSAFTLTQAQATTIIGYEAGYAINTAGDYNTVIGYQSAYTTDSPNNTAVGYYSLRGYSTGTVGHNTAIGKDALSSGSQVEYSTAVGSEALKVHSAASGYNTALGYQAGTAATSIIESVIIGAKAGKGVLTSGANGSVFIGYQAGDAVTSGAKNLAIGHNALSTEDTGSKNTAVGYQALTSANSSTVGAGNNTALGAEAGLLVSTGVGNTLVGSSSGSSPMNLDEDIYHSGVSQSSGGSATSIKLRDSNINTTDDVFNTASIFISDVTTSGGTGTIKATIDDYTGSTRVADLTSITLNGSTVTVSASTGLDSKAYTIKFEGTSSDPGGGTTSIKLASNNVPDDGFNNAIITITDAEITSGVTGNVTAIIGDYTQSTRVATLTSIRKVSDGSAVSALTSTGADDKAYVIEGNYLTTGSNNSFFGHDTGGSGTSNNQTALGYQAMCNGSNQITLGNSSVVALRCADTTIATLSDQRDKTNVTDSTFGLSFINSVRPVQYTWNRRNLEPGDTNSVLNGKRRLGFIAQELQSAMTDNSNEILDLVYEANPNRLEAKYGNFIPILVKAIQELKTENDSLAARIAALESA